MTQVNVYGKISQHCGLCEAAKEKLRLMGISFKSFEIAEILQWHEGWRNDESVEVQACYADIDTMPVITVDGKAYSYPAAMKVLRALKPCKPVETPTLVMDFVPVYAEEGELVAVG
jgi:hypothetical protein